MTHMWRANIVLCGLHPSIIRSSCYSAMIVPALPHSLRLCLPAGRRPPILNLCELSCLGFLDEHASFESSTERAITLSVRHVCVGSLCTR